jgi:hypothetical protein
VTTPRSTDSTLPRNWLRADIFMPAIVCTVFGDDNLAFRVRFYVLELPEVHEH